jgi:hypothetical protein
MYLYEPTSRSYTAQLRLNIHHDFSGHFYLDLSPYADRNLEDGVTGRAGAEMDIGAVIGDTALELFHHSAHNLDHESPLQDRRNLEMDAIRLRCMLRKY